MGSLALFGIQNLVHIVRARHQGKVIQEPLVKLDCEVSALHFGRKKLEDHYVTGQYNGKINLFDLGSQKPVRTYSLCGRENENLGVPTFFNTHDHSLIYTGFTDGSLRLYDTRSRACVCELTNHKISVQEGLQKETGIYISYKFNPITNLERYGEFGLFSCCSQKINLWDLRMSSVTQSISPKLTSGFLRGHIGLGSSSNSTIFCSTGSEVLAYSSKDASLLDTLAINGVVKDITFAGNVDELLVLYDSKEEKAGHSSTQLKIYHYTDNKFYRLDKLEMKDSYQRIKLSDDCSNIWAVSKLGYHINRNILRK